MEQTRPKYRPGHVRDFAPIHARRQRRADNTADACAGYDSRFDARLIQSFDNANMGQSTNGSTAESQTDSSIVKLLSYY